MGGDLKGVDQNLDYLKSLGVNTIYFNPIFDSASNHGYDTQDYFKIDPYFGTQKDWENLVKHADQLGMRIILDGVFNHHVFRQPLLRPLPSLQHAWAPASLPHRPTGAGSPSTTWRRARAPAWTARAGANSATYDGWFGFDSIPVLNKSQPVGAGSIS